MEGIWIGLFGGFWFGLVGGFAVFSFRRVFGIFSNEWVGWKRIGVFWGRGF